MYSLVVRWQLCYCVCVCVFSTKVLLFQVRKIRTEVNQKLQVCFTQAFAIFVLKVAHCFEFTFTVKSMTTISLP